MAITPSAFMRLTSADGNVQDVPLSGPGGTFRFGVGRTGFRSGVWRVWANKATPDLYFKSREVTGHHTSFHASGQWHHRFEDEQTALALTGKPVAYMDKWHRPDANNIGWTQAYSIWVPAEDVIAVPDDRQNSLKITWLPVPEPGYMVGVHIVVVQPDRGEAQLTDAIPMEAFTLCNGEIVLIMVSHHEVGAEERAVLDQHRARTRLAIGDQLPSPDGHAYRSSIWAIREEDGHRALYDLALFPREVNAANSGPSGDGAMTKEDTEPTSAEGP